MPLTEADRILLEQYIDGDLTGEALSLFERRVRAEPELRSEFALQREVSDSLRRAYTPSKITRTQVLGIASPTLAAAETLPPDQSRHAAEAREIAGRVGRPWFRRAAIAAALIGCAYGAWIVWPMLNQKPDSSATPKAPQLLTAADAYKSEVESGFEPDWVCANDQEFINTFKDRLGQGLVMKPATAQAQMLGLDYAKVLSPLTVTMLGEVDHQKVLVIIDRITQDKPDAVNAGLGGLHAFRREIGSLVLYEITPLEKPQMLDLIGEPGM